MLLGKFLLICLELVTVVIAEQLIHESSQSNIGKVKALPSAMNTKVLHPAKLQVQAALHELHEKQRDLQHKLQMLSHTHLQVLQTLAKGLSQPDLTRVLRQGKMAARSMKSDVEDGLHNLWNEADDQYHAVAGHIKEEIPVVKAGLKKVAPYAVPAAEILTTLLGRDLELEEIYARGLDWYLGDEE